MFLLTHIPPKSISRFNQKRWVLDFNLQNFLMHSNFVWIVHSWRQTTTWPEFDDSEMSKQWRPTPQKVLHTLIYNTYLHLVFLNLKCNKTLTERRLRLTLYNLYWRRIFLHVLYIFTCSLYFYMFFKYSHVL